MTRFVKQVIIGMGSESRRSRDEWLEAALEILAREGEARIRVRALSHALGVSTGSFYWHFRDRSDFLRSLISYWAQVYTTALIEQLSQSPLDAKGRLIAIGEGVIRESLGRYDMAIRAWAAHEPAILPLVRKVDRQRLGFVRRQFEELGFRGADLAMRARTFMTYYSLELSILVRQSKRERLEELRRRIELLCRP
ncbi:MAG: TetR/AcrR family transcriptional regulator [Planctomycetota bacterium]|jgi:AcrR family transcriptional regulator